jgi:hypothetical protein
MFLQKVLMVSDENSMIPIRTKMPRIRNIGMYTVKQCVEIVYILINPDKFYTLNKNKI